MSIVNRLGAVTSHYMLQSCTYVWKNKKFRDEEDSSIADEECARRPAEDDYGDVGKRPSPFREDC